MISSTVRVSLCGPPTRTGRIAFYSLCGWSRARLTAVDWNGICTCSCPLLYASATAHAALGPSGPGRPPAVHLEWIGKRERKKKRTPTKLKWEQITPYYAPRLETAQDTSEMLYPTQRQLKIKKSKFNQRETCKRIVYEFNSTTKL